MEPLHQSLRYRVPHGIGQNPQEVLKALLNQKCALVLESNKWIRNEDQALDRKSISSLYLKSEKLPLSMHIYASRIDKWKRKRNIPNPSKPEWKDASSDHAEDGYHICYHQSLQCMPWPWPDKGEISTYDYGASECLDTTRPCHRPPNQCLYHT